MKKLLLLSTVLLLSSSAGSMAFANINLPLEDKSVNITQNYPCSDIDGVEPEAGLHGNPIWISNNQSFNRGLCTTNDMDWFSFAFMETKMPEPIINVNVTPSAYAQVADYELLVYSGDNVTDPLVINEQGPKTGTETFSFGAPKGVYSFALRDVLGGVGSYNLSTVFSANRQTVPEPYSVLGVDPSTKTVNVGQEIMFYNNFYSPTDGTLWTHWTIDLGNGYSHSIERQGNPVLGVSILDYVQGYNQPGTYNVVTTMWWNDLPIKTDRATITVNPLKTIKPKPIEILPPVYRLDPVKY